MPDKLAWLDQILQVIATTNNENILKQQIVTEYFRINQHGWTKIFNVTATTKDENSLKEQNVAGYSRINKETEVIFNVLQHHNAEGRCNS